MQSHSPSADSKKTVAHPSLYAPKCIDCTHASDIDTRHPTCAHPKAERNLIDGRLARTCWIERNSLRSYCGPDGLGFLPKTLPQSL